MSASSSENLKMRHLPRYCAQSVRICMKFGFWHACARWPLNKNPTALKESLWPSAVLMVLHVRFANGSTINSKSKWYLCQFRSEMMGLLKCVETWLKTLWLLIPWGFAEKNRGGTCTWNKFCQHNLAPRNRYVSLRLRLYKIISNKCVSNCIARLVFAAADTAANARIRHCTTTDAAIYGWLGSGRMDERMKYTAYLNQSHCGTRNIDCMN